MWWIIGLGVINGILFGILDAHASVKSERPPS